MQRIKTNSIVNYKNRRYIYKEISNTKAILIRPKEVNKNIEAIKNKDISNISTSYLKNIVQKIKNKEEIERIFNIIDLKNKGELVPTKLVDSFISCIYKYDNRLIKHQKYSETILIEEQEIDTIIVLIPFEEANISLFIAKSLEFFNLNTTWITFLYKYLFKIKVLSIEYSKELQYKNIKKKLLGKYIEPTKTSYYEEYQQVGFRIKNDTSSSILTFLEKDLEFQILSLNGFNPAKDRILKLSKTVKIVNNKGLAKFHKNEFATIIGIQENHKTSQRTLITIKSTQTGITSIAYPHNLKVI